MNILPLLLLSDDNTDLFKGKYWLEAAMNLINNTIEGFQQIITGLNGASDVTASIDFTAFGQTLTALFFIMQAFEQMTDFRFDRIEDAIKIALKYVMAKVIIENSSGIVGAIYNGIFKQYGLSLLVEEMDTFQNSLNIITANDSSLDPGLLGINYLLSGFLMFGVWIILITMLVKMAATVAGILFEIAMHKVVAPIALSTLCNDTAKNCGISFIKSYAAVCLQACIIAICFNLYPSIAATINTRTFLAGVNGTGSVIEVISSAICPIVSMIILSTTVTKSGDITKRMLGA